MTKLALRSRAISAVVLAGLLGVHSGCDQYTPPDPVEVEWLTSWERAAAEAQETGRPILANFTGSDWCHFCVKLKREVFNTETFQRWSEKNVVLLEVDFPRTKSQPLEIKEQNRELSQRYGVGGLPTVLLLDPWGGELARSGYQPGGARNWIAQVEPVVAGYRNSANSAHEPDIQPVAP